MSTFKKRRKRSRQNHVIAGSTYYGPSSSKYYQQYVDDSEEISHTMPDLRESLSHPGPSLTHHTAGARVIQLQLQDSCPGPSRKRSNYEYCGLEPDPMAKRYHDIDTERYDATNRCKGSGSRSKGKQAKPPPKHKIERASLREKIPITVQQPVSHVHMHDQEPQKFIWTLQEMHTLSEKSELFMEATKMGNFIRSTRDACDEKRILVFIKMLSIICKALSSSDFRVFEEAFIAIMEKLGIFDQTGIHFWGILSVLIRKAPYLKESEKNVRSLLQNVYKIARELLEAREEISTKAIQCLPLDELCGTLKQVCDKNEQYKSLFEDCNQLLLKRDSLREKQLAVESMQIQTDSETSIYAILPTIEELRAGHLSSELKKNRIKGCFDSAQQYIETHYFLLREDFMHPLRNVIEESLELEEGQTTRYMYENVKFTGKDISYGEIVYQVSFKFQGQKKTNWQHNRRFTYGSLLCLSREEDYFQVLFATVAQREIQDLKKGLITVKVLCEESHFHMDAESTYIMLESPAYFEAYGPVLSCLKRMMISTDNLPMEKYLVACETDRISPIYLRSASELLLDLSPITGGDTMASVLVPEDVFCSVIQPTDLDESQVKALHLALTSELALIQGPPGTGKTFIGIKLVEILLQNRKLWNPLNRAPIMVMCYTNHALDQFLNGILDIPGNIGARGHNKFDILRVGGRSKSERIQKLNLNNELARTRQASRKRSRWRATKKELAIIECKVQALEELCFGRQYNSLNELLYYSFLHDSEVQQLRELKMHIPEVSTESILTWFGIDLKQELSDEENDDEKIYKHWKAQEDDRKIFDHGHQKIDQSKGSFVKNLVDKKNWFQLRKLFKNIQRIYDVHHSCENPQNLSEKIALFKYCLKKYLKQLKMEYEEIRDRTQANEEKEDNLKVTALQKADIVGFTTTGASRLNKVISKLRPKIVIVEEAAEVLEGHLIASLTPHIQHLILIGDHKQLRPKSNHHILGKEYGLEISLFERLINNDLPYATLKYQHRMRPEISQLVHPHIYPELYDHESVMQYPNIDGMLHNLFFVSQLHNPETDVDDLRSPSNENEAWFVAKLCRYLLQQGYVPGEITLLTPYIGQVACLRHCFNELRITNVRIMPVDHYQGEENEIILLSLVRSSRPGFVKEDNRVCVALSRAKQGFYCIGNFDMFSKHSSLWKAIVDSLQKKGLVGSSLPLKCQSHGNITYVSSADCFEKIKDGGCDQVCRQRLRCGHICPRGCHFDDADHHQPCNKPCGQLCHAKLHTCPLKCNEECQSCKVEVEKVVPGCGHLQNIPCCEAPEYYVCKEPCKKLLACGHQCKAFCGEPCEMKECKFFVMKTLPCGHQARLLCSLNAESYPEKCNIECRQELSCGHMCQGTCGQCHQGRLHVLCKKKCERKLLCGHICASSTCCSSSCPPCIRDCPFSCPHGACGEKCHKDCIKCREPCMWQCEHEQCTMPCGEPCNRQRCNKPCTKKLRCYHPCMGLCGELCPPVCHRCDPRNETFEIFFGSEEELNARFIMLPECKHNFEVCGLDEYMDGTHTSSEDVAVKWKGCPRCTKPITTSLRYANVLKDIKKDFSNVKKAMRNSTDLLPVGHKAQMVKEVVAMNEKTGKEIIKGNLHEFAQSLSHNALLGAHARLCALSDGHDIKLKLASINLKSIPRTDKERTELLAEYNRLQSHVDLLMMFVKSHRTKLTQLPDQLYNDIHCERRRVKFLLSLYILQVDICCSKVSVKEEDLKFISDGRLQFNPSDGKPRQRLMDETDYIEKIKKIQQITKCYGLGKPTLDEVRVIVKALGAKHGSWYKCPNGHYYNIGECGGAMQEGRCNECKAKIGGKQHRLQDDNSHAGEVDGSSHAAWSEMANIRNFELP